MAVLIAAQQCKPEFLFHPQGLCGCGCCRTLPPLTRAPNPDDVIRYEQMQCDPPLRRLPPNRHPTPTLAPSYCILSGGSENKALCLRSGVPRL